MYLNFSLEFSNNMELDHGELITKLETMRKNFMYIRERSSHLPQLSAARGMDLIARLCKAEHDDYASRNQKLKTDNLLGKRKEKHILNLTKELDWKKIKPEHEPTDPLAEEGEFKDWSDEKKRIILECIGDDLEKLKQILKIHQLKTANIRREQSSGNKAQKIEDELEPKQNKKTIYQHERNLIEVAIYSKLSMEDKFSFLWDVVSEEFDKDELESRYFEYLELILGLISQWDDLKVKGARAWEYFIKKLPLIDKRILDHIYEITKKDKSSILLYEVVQFSSKEMKIEAINYMLRSGNYCLIEAIQEF